MIPPLEWEDLTGVVSEAIDARGVRWRCVQLGAGDRWWSIARDGVYLRSGARILRRKQLAHAKLYCEVHAALEGAAIETKAAREAEGLGHHDEPASQRMHTFKPAPNWGDVCDVCGESEDDPRHGVQ